MARDGVSPSPPPDPPAPPRAVGDAFDELYHREYLRSLRLAVLLTGAETESEDLVQEVFVAISKRLDRLDNPIAYLRTTIVNLARQYHRNNSRRTERLRLLVPRPDGG